MGATIYSDNKMQYYPTDSIITMQTLCTIANYCSDSTRNDTSFDELKKKVYQEVSAIDLLKYTIVEACKDKELHSKIKFTFSGKVIADLFAGEGEWLSIFKNNTEGENILIGNELEENRYNNMINNNSIDYAYNLPFEDLQLPKNIIDVMLFNPPYGTTNGMRNARRYLQMIFQRELMADGGLFISVLNEIDVRDCIDILLLNLTNISIYKTHQEEFDKFGQYVVFGVIRKYKINTNNLNEMVKHNENVKQNISLFECVKENNIGFNKDLAFKYRYGCSSSIKNHMVAFENLQYIQSNYVKLSSKDKALKWLINDTELIDLGSCDIEIPKPLKSGEIANIIASGKINGEISLENGEGNHIVVGGVKQVTKTSLAKIVNKKGETEDKKITTKQSVPFLNILIKNKDGIKIKELGD